MARTEVIAVSFIILFIGVGGIYGFIPLPGSIVNTFSIAQPTVSCAPQNQPGVCTVNVSVTNNNATQQANLWFLAARVCSTCQAFLVTQQLITSPAGSSQTFAQSLGNLGCGTYIVTMKVLSLAGNQLLSYSQSPTFSPCISLQIDLNGASVAVSPTTSSITGAGSNNPTYTFASGTQVTLTATPPQYTTFQCWQYVAGGTACPTSNPLTFVLNQNTELAPTATAPNPPQALQYVQVIAQAEPPSGGTVSPSIPQKVFQPAGTLGTNGIAETCQDPSGQCPTSVTFAATANTQGIPPSNFFNWYNCVTTCKAIGNSPSITQNYAQALQYASGGPNSAEIIAANFTSLLNGQLNIFDSPSWPGKVTLTPSPGTYYYASGTSVTIKATGLPTTCPPQQLSSTCLSLNGFIVDGQLTAQGQTSVTVVMNQVHGVAPNIIQTVCQGIACGCSGAGGAFVSCTTQSSSTSNTGGGGTCVYTYTTTTNLIIYTITNTVTATASAGSPQCNNKGGTVSPLAIGLTIAGIIGITAGAVMPSRRKGGS